MNRALVRQQMLDLIRLRHLALKTEEAYLGWFDRYANFIAARKPSGCSAEKMGAYLSHLATRGVSASTQNQAFNALIFLYREVLKQELKDIQSLRAKKGTRVRIAPSVEEMRRLLQAVEDVHGYPTRLIVALLYGAGLRLNEGLGLRIKDVRLAESRLAIRDPKHGTDRFVALPCSLIGPIRKQMERAKLLFEVDQEKKLPVKLPGLLAKKYPRAPFSWNWYWLFPMHQPCRDPRSNELVRWHCLDVNVQRAVRGAVQRANLDGMITPHVLRHAWATHAKDQGSNIRAIQQALGHKSLETTMIYVHADATSVASPLDRMMVEGGVAA